MPNPILTDFLVVDNARRGYYCRYGDFYLDPLEPVSQAVISHGHGDHATPGHGMSYCTAPTVAFVEARYSRIHLAAFTAIPYREPFRIGEVTLTFIPAGHILGSAQILMEHRGVRYLYTGDYKMQADPTCEPLEACNADVLITETTFANPAVRHPDPVTEILKLSGIPHHIMLGAYGLGKAQRLTALINKHCPDKHILVHYSIAPLHRIYEHYGVELGPYTLYNRKLMKSPATQQSYVYIVPPMTFRSYIRARNVVRVFASGWEALQRNNDLSLYISDHVDWSDLLGYVDRVQPREIWTIHGDGRHLIEHFGDQLAVRAL